MSIVSHHAKRLVNTELDQIAIVLVWTDHRMQAIATTLLETT